jgi:hypothetical protein
MKIREYEGVFYNSEDFDVTGRPYEDAVPVREETEQEKKERIQKAQMADDVHNDKHKKDCKNGGCNCMNEYILLFSNVNNDGVKYDYYGFKIEDFE